MSRGILLAAVAAAAFPCGLSAADKTDAKTMVKKGVDYLGGEKLLKKYKAATWQDKGTYYGMGGDGLPYTGKYAVLWPDKVKMEIAGAFTHVLNGNSGWIDMMGTVKDLTKKQLERAKEGQHEAIITQLHPLLVGKTYRLSVDGTAKIGKTETTIVKVKDKGYPDVRLFLDPKTGALLKSETMALPEDGSDKRIKQETFYDAYKTAKGMKYASKVRFLHNGKKFVESTVTEFIPLESLSAKTFAKPK